MDGIARKRRIIKKIVYRQIRVNLRSTPPDMPTAMKDAVAKRGQKIRKPVGYRQKTAPRVLGWGKL